VKNEEGLYRGLQPFYATIVTENGAITGSAIAAVTTTTARKIAT
jgi:hypothetical protein